MTHSQHNPNELLDHAVWIRNLARQLVGEGPAAEDLVQDTWAAALRSQPDRSRSLRPWLAQVLRNFAGQMVRRSKSRPQLEELGEPAHDSPSPEELVVRGEMQALLVKEVLALREPFRTALMLRYYEGRSPTQIARAMGVPPATVRGRLKRAIDELRLRLDETHGGNRQTWVLTCLPLASGESSIGGVLMSHGGLKLGVGVASLVLLTWAGSHWGALRLGAGETEGTPAGLVGLPELENDTREELITEGGFDRERRAVAQLGQANVLGVPITPWSGFLMDPATGESVPEFLFQWKQAGRVEELRSDEHGRFTSSLAMEAGAYQLWLRDNPDVPRSTGIDMRTGRFRMGAADWETRQSLAGTDSDVINVPVGPTYFLEIVGTPAPEELELKAQLVRSAEVGYERSPGQGVGVRVGERQWVRFAPFSESSHAAAGGTLRVWSLDGYWAGEAAVASLRGIEATPVLIELVAQGAVAGRVQELSGVAVANCEAVLERVGGASENMSVACITSLAGDGRFEFEHLAVGSYRMSFLAKNHKPLFLDLEVQPLKTSEVIAELERTAPSDTSPGLSVSGNLSSASGKYRANVVVLLSGPETDSINVHWARVAGRLEASYEFTGLLPGEYEVSVFSLLDLFDWGAARTVFAPSTDVDFIVADSVPTLDLQFDVRDSETGDSIQPFDLGTTTRGGGPVVMEGFRSGGIHVRAIPKDADYSWAIHAAGYATSYGDLADFQPPGEGSLIVPMELTRGWRGRFMVWEAGTRRPVVGAEIFVDDRLAGTTDGTGRVIVENPDTPASVSARHEGLQGSIEHFTPSMPHLPIVIE